MPALRTSTGLVNDVLNDGNEGPAMFEVRPPPWQDDREETSANRDQPQLQSFWEPAGEIS